MYTNPENEKYKMHEHTCCILYNYSKVMGYSQLTGKTLLCIVIVIPCSTMERCTIILLQGETRRVYNLLMEEDAENFEGWKIVPG